MLTSTGSPGPTETLLCWHLLRCQSPRRPAALPRPQTGLSCSCQQGEPVCTESPYGSSGERQGLSLAPPESRHRKTHAGCTGRQGGVGAGFSGGKWYKQVHSHHCVLCNGYHVPDRRPPHTHRLLEWHAASARAHASLGEQRGRREMTRPGQPLPGAVSGGV